MELHGETDRFSSSSGRKLSYHPEYENGSNSKSTAEKWFPVMMSLTLAGLATYVAFSMCFMVSANYIIEAYVSQWRVEVRNLKVSPDPALLDDWTDNKASVNIGSKDHINISFVISLSNNPSWLEVYVDSVQLLEPYLTSIPLKVRMQPFKGDSEVLVRRGYLPYHVERGKYEQLWNKANSGRRSTMWLELYVRVSVFGYQRKDFVLTACAAYSASTGPNSTESELVYADEYFGRIAQVTRQEPLDAIVLGRLPL